MLEAIAETIGGTFGAAMTTPSMDFVIGRVWAREPKLAGSKSSHAWHTDRFATTDDLRNHIRIGLTNGLTQSELEEVLMQAATYGAFPAAHAASEAATEILNGLKREQDPCAAD